MTKRGNITRKSKEQRNEKLTFGPEVEGIHEVRYQDTFDLAVLGQPAGDGPASPNREAVARHKLFDDVSCAEGL